MLMMDTTRITFGMIVLNGVPFILYNLRALYPYAHQIIIVEGATPSARSIATPGGHSIDSTIQIIKEFQATEDTEHKVTLITAEDEGHVNGFWPGEKDEMSQAYAKRATGNYLWQIDTDEFYMPFDMDKIIGMLRSDPTISAVSFRVLTFWGGLKYRTDGFYLQRGAHNFHRLFAWGPGYIYHTHRPPTVLDENGIDLRSKRHLTASVMARHGIYLYHYELLLPKQVREKCDYYKNADWTDMGRDLDKWMHNSYFTLSFPFRVHMVYKSLSWLERYTGNHPPQVVEMVHDVLQGSFVGVELRPVEDIENLMKSFSYTIGRGFLKALVPVYKLLLGLKDALKKCIKGTELWCYFRKHINYLRGGLVPVHIKKVTPRWLNAWKANTIPQAQLQVVNQELHDMYEGRVGKHFLVLAEAIKQTGREQGKIVEVGCSSGYYYEILKHLLKCNINYLGIDYSEAMIAEAKRRYQDAIFKVGDATCLPLKNDSCDILISGGVLLHVLDWKKAIAESVRVSKKWVIFHRTPITNGTTQYFKKKAYGVPCLEVHFGNEEFSTICKDFGLVLRGEWIISGNNEGAMITYLYEKNEI